MPGTGCRLVSEPSLRHSLTENNQHQELRLIIKLLGEGVLLPLFGLLKKHELFHAVAQQPMECSPVDDQ